jgi:hypothetical protein
MSAKERERLKVLHEVNKRHIPQKQAAGELGLSVRWVRHNGPLAPARPLVPCPQFCFFALPGLIYPQEEVAVGTTLTSRPPHRTVRAHFTHTAPTADE